MSKKKQERFSKHGVTSKGHKSHLCGFHWPKMGKFEHERELQHIRYLKNLDFTMTF